MKPSLIDKLQHLTERLEEVTALLASPDVTKHIAGIHRQKLI